MLFQSCIGALLYCIANWQSLGATNNDAMHTSPVARQLDRFSQQQLNMLLC